MKIFFLIFTFVIVTASSTYAQGAQQSPPLASLDKLMSADQKKEMGLDKLMPEQKLKLETWLTRFALRMAQAGAAMSTHGAGILPASGTYAGAGAGHWVKDKIDDGAMIRLDDGSLWEISSVDKINTELWLTTEDITITESKNPSYPYTLVNTSSKDSAEAKLIGK